MPKFVSSYRPDLVLITLGANELEIPKPEERVKPIKHLVSSLAGRPCVWIAPPVWKPDTGLLKVIRDNVAPCRYLDSNALVHDLPRARDKIHPSTEGRQIWAKIVFDWLAKERLGGAGAALGAEARARRELAALGSRAHAAHGEFAHAQARATAHEERDQKRGEHTPEQIARRCVGREVEREDDRESKPGAQPGTEAALRTERLRTPLQAALPPRAAACCRVLVAPLRPRTPRGNIRAQPPPAPARRKRRLRLRSTRCASQNGATPDTTAITGTSRATICPSNGRNESSLEPPTSSSSEPSRSGRRKRERASDMLVREP